MYSWRGAAAAFAWVQAHAAVKTLEDARDARDDARRSANESARLAAEANDAFKRQAEAQEEANRIKREEMAPKDWTVAQIDDNAWRVTNTSQRLLSGVTFNVEPDGTERLVSITTSHQDGRYEFGDSFQFGVTKVWGPNPEKLTIRYSHADDEAEDTRTLHLSM